ncbi:unnamed protein product [marine sediment metagenome]|uniref:Tetrahaem cytochrome domain-containing protein n=1 Tax=marine sediment metagenome TaxID=412755 RepID=X0SFH6_9ZZZZ
MSRAWPIGVIAAGLLLVVACAPGERRGGVAGPGESEQRFGRLGANAGCYVCHMTFVREPLSATHLAAKVTCVRCHGPSAAHANDEDIGATPPDVIIQRDRINPSCRVCHKTHDVAPEKIVTRWLEHSQRRATSQPAPSPAACTDCHGKHRISDT